MNTIILHTPQNEQSWTYRYYNHFWKFFIEFLKTKFVVEEDTYFEYANMRAYDVKLLNDATISNLLECEMIIENKSTKEFVVLSVSDNLTGAILNHKTNPLCKKIIFSQFDEEVLINHIGEEMDKYSPWIYFPSNLFDLDSIYKLRREKTELMDKFCFWGTSLEERKILKHFDTNVFDGGKPIGGFYDYAKTLISYKAALSISGRAEFCYRDIENFAIGVPILRFEYVNKMYEPLIPNYHYISVDRPSDLSLDREGDKKHAQLLEDRFHSVKDDTDFLEFISNNARKYYEDNLSPHKSMELTYNLLQLNEWE